MTPARTDRTGAPVTVEIEPASPISAYVVRVADGTTASRADFIDSSPGADERIFFHTEVDEAFGGRGLAGLLVREALEQSIREGLTVVAVCPLFARHLRDHGDAFVAEGGAFRRPTSDDIALVARAIRSRT